jgi:hypothetical protein
MTQWMASLQRVAAGKSQDKPARRKNKGSAGTSPVQKSFFDSGFPTTLVDS